MIKFPRLHIAQSVTNRILNVARDVESSGLGSMASTPSPTPPVPDPEPMGAQVEAALSQPTAPVAADPTMVEAAVVDTLL